MKKITFLTIALIAMATLLKGQAPSLGSYPNISVISGKNISISPDVAPANTSNIIAFTNSSFTGTFIADPVSGIVFVTDAKQAGIYPVTVKVFGPGGTFSRTFTLTVTNPDYSPGIFVPSGTTGVGANPNCIAIGDFNRDGKQDYATANYNSNDVSISMGDGSGGFSGTTNIAVGVNPIYVAVGDFNEDGKQDFATANTGSGNISVKTGDGTGNFSGSTTLNPGAAPYAVAVGDFNNDGHQDIVSAVYGLNAVAIFFGDGLGGFVSMPSVAVGSGPWHVVVGDFNNDSNQDIATANSGTNTVSIRLGDGLGGFSGSTEIGVGGITIALAIADFNNDGIQDFVAANFSNTVAVRLGNGTGGFTGSTSVSVGPSAWFIAIGDFNGDGNQDFVTPNEATSTVSVRFGNGSGGFTGTGDINVGSSPFSVAVGDFNADGHHDIATAINGPNYVAVLLGAGNEINVRGNGVTIVDGDAVATFADHTDFGSVLACTGTIVRTFRIENTGTALLSITGVTITGANAGDFALTLAPASTISAGGFTNFQVTFDPSVTGSCNATINIANDDCDENPYNFAIRGTGNADIVNPSIYCPGNIAVNNTPGLCGAMVIYTIGTSDNCPSTLTQTDGSGFTSGSLFPIGTHTQTYMVTDGGGNIATCSFTVTVADNEAPAALCHNLNLYLNSAGTANLTPGMLDNGSTDNCSITGRSLSVTSVNCANIGPNNVTLTVTDGAGNSSNCIGVVNVLDSIKPVAICQSGTIPIPLDGTGNATILPSLVNNGSSDACGISMMTVSPNTFNCASQGYPTLTLTVTDNNGNTSTCTSTAIVYDDAPPIANCQNINVYLDGSGNANIVPAMVNNGSTDECQIATSSVTPNTFTCSNAGLNNVTLTIFDTMGATDQCTSVVTVIDTVRPVAIAQNLTVTLSGGIATVTAAAINNGSSDACGIASMSVTPNSFACSELGANTVTLTVTDVNGNSSTATAIVTVLSDLTSSATVNSNVSCFGGNNGLATITTSGGAGPFTYSWSPTGGIAATASGLPAGAYTVTATDAGGCTTSSTVSITEPLTAIAAASVAGNILCNGASTTVTVTGNGGTSPYTGEGTFTVTAGIYSYTVTDANGCTATTSITVTEPTALSASSSSTFILCNGGTTNIAVAGSGGMFPYSGTGTFTVTAGAYTYTVTDANSCASTTTITVSEPAVLVASILNSISPTTCNGTNGSIDIAVSGGTSGYSFLWNTSAITEDLTGIGAGIYNCTVTDNNGCTTQVSASLSDPNPPSVTFDLLIDTVCVTDAIYTLSGGLPNGGTYSGLSVIGGSFDPSTASMGINYIFYSYTDINACTSSSTDSIYVDVCTGINSVATKENSFIIMPNPNNGTFNLQLNTNEIATVIISDSFGQLISTKKIQPRVQEQFNIINSGVYQVTVITTNGSYNTQRVIISR